ncbi:ORF12 [Agrotis segetum granulovirus]|uniref:ORF12 n=1 Tax=Agrotis segetum granulosis virus TaxID=10464 RepID=Q6QXD1_GVAS|nr:ORF12 [Agrotis segetum granulovirus]AHN92052.1 p49 [Agrotis segetum granulovirus]
MDSELLKHVFIATYFDLDQRDHLNSDVRRFLNEPSEEDVISYLDYLDRMQLKNIVVDKSADLFKYIKPQFKYVCEREYDLDIVKYNYSGVFLRKGAVVYATNLFVVDPSDTISFFITKFGIEKGYTSIEEKHVVCNGTDGVFFGRAYLDWLGLKVCSGNKYREDEHYRLYIIGEHMAQQFIQNNIGALEGSELRNFYKGTPLTYTKNAANIINQKSFVTDNMDVVFDNFAEEFDQNVDYIKFVQRDYIYDASNFPTDLLEELQQHYVSLTSVYKIINRFQKSSIPMVGKELVVDRYAVTKYKKMITTPDFVLPGRENNMHIFIPRDFIQLRHTLNAAFVPELGIVILAEHVFFGANRVLDFDPRRGDLYVFVKRKTTIDKDEVYYHIGGEFYLEETQFASNQIPVFVLVRIDNDLLVRDNLRTSRKLKDLNYNWVDNTILNLFVKK